MIFSKNPRFNLLHGDESDPSLVLDIQPDGKDRSTAGLDMTAQADWILGGEYGTGDGTGDYLKNSTADFRSSDQSGTIAAWVRPTAITTNRTIFASSDEASLNNFLVLMIHGTSSKFRIWTRPNGAANDTILDSTTAASTNQWYHIVVTSSGTTTKMYLNGALETLIVTDGTNDGEWFADVTGRDNVTVGMLSANSDLYAFQGDIANVRVYSGEWTADECLADYLSGVPETDLVAAWGPDGKDYSRFGLDMTPQADAIVGDRITLDGTGDYLKNSTGNWRSNDSLGTVMAWIKLSATGAFQAILATSDEGTATSAWLFDVTNTNVLRAYTQNAGGSLEFPTGSTALVANRWYHVALTSSGTAYAMYVDGVAETISGTNNGRWFGDITLRDNITVGALEWTSVVNDLAGDIGYVKVYNTAKSADYIKAVYEAERDWAR